MDNNKIFIDVEVFEFQSEEFKDQYKYTDAFCKSFFGQKITVKLNDLLTKKSIDDIEVDEPFDLVITYRKRFKYVVKCKILSVNKEAIEKAEDQFCLSKRPLSYFFL